MLQIIQDNFTKDTSHSTEHSTMFKHKYPVRVNAMIDEIIKSGISGTITVTSMPLDDNFNAKTNVNNLAKFKYNRKVKNIVSDSDFASDIVRYINVSETDENIDYELFIL